MRKIKSLAMMLIAISLIACLTACGTNPSDNETPKNNKEEVVTTVKNDTVAISGEIGTATDVKVAELDVESTEYTALTGYLADKATNYAAYDITIANKNGEAVQPDGKVKVTIKLSDEMLAAAGDAYSVLYVNGAEVTKLDCTEKDGYVTFETTHFSIYTVVKYESEGEVESEIEALPTETPTPIPTEPPHEHNYTEVEGSEVAATCTTDGKKADKVCECGDKVEGEVVKATGHAYGEYKSDGNATYDADGTKTAECSVCGEKDTVTDAGSKLERPKYTYTDMNKTMYAKSSVNVRDLPSTDGNKLGGLSSGQAVAVTGKCNETGWYRIDYNGSIAYVSNSYLVDNKPAEPKPEEPTSGDPCNVPGLPFVPFQIYDEGNMVYYWYPSGSYSGYGTFTAQKNAAYEECRSIMSDRYGSFEFQNQYEDYYYECSWGNAHKNGKNYIRYCKYAFYVSN